MKYLEAYTAANTHPPIEETPLSVLIFTGTHRKYPQKLIKCSQIYIIIVHFDSVWYAYNDVGKILTVQGWTLRVKWDCIYEYDFAC